jgi:hypothetical protein
VRHDGLVLTGSIKDASPRTVKKAAKRMGKAMAAHAEARYVVLSAVAANVSQSSGKESEGRGITSVTVDGKLVCAFYVGKMADRPGFEGGCLKGDKCNRAHITKASHPDAFDRSLEWIATRMPYGRGSK